MLLEEERPVIPGITVKAATVDALVDLLIESFCKYLVYLAYNLFLCYIVKVLLKMFLFFHE